MNKLTWAIRYFIRLTSRSPDKITSLTVEGDSKIIFITRN